MAITFQQTKGHDYKSLPVRLRSDLDIRPQQSLGGRYWVVKEPLGLKYFRFQDEEYALLKLLNGSNTLESIRDQFEKDFAPRKLRLETLNRFIGRLHEKGLLLIDLPGRGRKLVQLAEQAKRARRRAAFSNVFAIRFPGFDPDALLTRLNRYTWPLFSPFVFAIATLFVLSALFLVTLNFGTFVSRLPAAAQFYGPANVHWLILSLILCKVVHEFGHGLACKRFGGECHQMGAMLLVFMPVMYCDVSDSWLLGSKWKRIAIAAAGIYFELIIAATATFGWWFSEPGLFNSICLSIVFLTSVSTLLVNANPLMRFDGYYILSDLLEIPNLAGRASNTLRSAVSELFLGIRLTSNRVLESRRFGWLLSYALASAVYRWFILFAIVFFLNSVLALYGLQIFGNILAFLGFVGLAVAPLWKFGKVLSVPGMTHRMNPRRIAIATGLFLSALLVFCFLPLPHSISGDGYVTFRDAETIYAVVPGKLDAIIASYGQQVEVGDPIAKLTNPEIEFTIAELEGHAEVIQAQLTSLDKSRLVSREAGRSIRALEESLHATQRQLEKRKEDQANLVRYASQKGILLPSATHFRATSFQNTTAHNSADPLVKQSLGKYLRAGDFLCQIGDPRKLELVILIGQAEIEMVREGAQVEAYFASHPLQSVTTELSEVSQAESRFSPLVLATNFGGRLAMQPDQSGVGSIADTVYRARAPIENEDLLLSAGVRCQVRIQAATQTLAQRMLRWVRSTFRFKWQTGESL